MSNYTGTMQKPILYPKCMKCGGVANAGGCKVCELWFCKEHIYRHDGCSEGR